MASILCSIHLHFPSSSSSSCSSSSERRLLRSQFLEVGGRGYCKKKVATRVSSSKGSNRITSWFKFGKNGLDSEGAGIYGSQSRDDFDRDDVEQYFNYMGMLAVEGSYDKMNDLLNQNIHPVDILLMLAATEGDRPKVEELMRAGAKYDVKDGDGRTALERAASDEIRELILNFSVQNV